MQVATALYLAIAACCVLGLVAAYVLDQSRSTGRSRRRLVQEWWWQQVHTPGRHWARTALVTLALLAGVAALALAIAPSTGPAGSPDPVLAERETTTEPVPPDSAGRALAITAAPPGSTPAEVSVALSRQLHPDGGAEHVVLAHDVPSADAIAAAGLQGLLDGAFLLTAGGELSPATAAEIDRLGFPSVHVLGGAEAVATAVEEELVAAGHDVHRDAGPARVETAVDVALRHFPDARAAVLVPALSGEEWQDRLVSAFLGGGLAAAHGLPVLLSGPEALSQGTAAYLERSGVREVVVVGREPEIGQPVMDELADLGVSAARLAGPDRFATAVAVSAHGAFASDDGEDVVVLVEGSGDGAWPGLALAAAYAGREGAPILLTSGAELPEATREELAARRRGGVRVLCMPGVQALACTAAGEVLDAP